MSKSTKVAPFVTAAVVREAFRSGALDMNTVTDAKGKAVSTASIVGAKGDGKVRGRIHPAFVAAFNEANKGKAQYAEKSEADAKTVTLPLTKPNARGARIKKPETFTLAEVRVLAGVSGKRGRLGSAALAKATDAVMKERGWL